jgi:NAD(P)-dependent dehydrogenase (short-subunit alcohol dehydrogenase family)
VKGRNALLPDTIETPANQRALPNSDFERSAKSEEVADVIVWLCSSAAKVVSGNPIRLVGNSCDKGPNRRGSRA